MSPHLVTVTQLCRKFMTFDPNYNYEEEEEDDEDSMEVEDGDEGLSFVGLQTLQIKKFKKTKVDDDLTTGWCSVSTRMIRKVLIRRKREGKGSHFILICSSDLNLRTF